MRRFATLGGNGRGDQDTRNAAARLSRRIFAAFDAQETDDVDFVEVAAGLAVLAPASMDDKIEAAFALYDVTRGGVAFEELRGYLLAVYRVQRACSASLSLRIHQAGGPLKLADDTAAACFRSRRLGDEAPLDVRFWVVARASRPPTGLGRPPFSPLRPNTTGPALSPKCPLVGKKCPAHRKPPRRTAAVAVAKHLKSRGMGTSTQVVLPGRNMTILEFSRPQRPPSVPTPRSSGPWLPQANSVPSMWVHLYAWTGAAGNGASDQASVDGSYKTALYSTDSGVEPRRNLAMTTKHPCRSKPVMLRGSTFCRLEHAGAAKPTSFRVEDANRLRIIIAAIEIWLPTDFYTMFPCMKTRFIPQLRPRVCCGSCATRRLLSRP